MASIYLVLTKEHLQKIFLKSNDFVSNESSLLNNSFKWKNRAKETVKRNSYLTFL